MAFGEEGVFRGVVMRVLLARGVRPALFGSATLFGLMHVMNLGNHSHPITVAAQVLMTFGIGIGFGAVALATGTIWPLLVIHFLMDFLNDIQAAAPGENTGVATSDLLLNGALDVALGLLAAGYGMLQVIEGIGLWGGWRWAEYLAAIATSVFVPLEVYELVDHPTVFKGGALLVNLVAVAYLVFKGRLFGIRGGHRAYLAEVRDATLLADELVLAGRDPAELHGHTLI